MHSPIAFAPPLEMTEVSALVEGSQFQNMLLEIIAGSLRMERRLALGDLHRHGELVHGSATSKEELKPSLPVLALPAEPFREHDSRKNNATRDEPANDCSTHLSRHAPPPSQHLNAKRRGHGQDCTNVVCHLMSWPRNIFLLGF